MDKVIVIGGSVSGYGIIRALANKNIQTIALTYEGNIAHLSRYVSEAVCIQESEEQLVALLSDNAHKWEGALILETADYMATTLSKNKERLSKYYRIATPDWETLSIFVEKEKTYALSETCSVPFPRSIWLTQIEDIEGLSEIRYPCILKPVRSFELVTKFGLKNIEVSNEKELREKFKLCADAGIPMILQEIIPGPDENLYRLDGYINSEGKMVGKFFCRKLRQNPPFFGVMRVGVSTEPYPEIEQFTERLLRHVNYRGYFSTEFKKDPRDGQLKLMENNCRLVRCSLLATASGVNHPWIMYQDLVNNHQIDVTDYRTGTYWIELNVDLSKSLFRHNKEDISLRDYIKPYLSRDKVFADLDVHDIKPFMELARQRIGNISRRAFHPGPSEPVLQTH